jgi:putative FmdB family regulatory protein
MPTYQYKCAQSGKLIERINSIKQHCNRVQCQCGSEANQVILSAPLMTIPAHMRYDFNGYESPTTGRLIRNKRERIEDLAVSECMEYDPGVKQDADRRVKESEAALDKAVDETVEKEFESMPLLKREQLATELTAGANIETIRL